MKLIMLSVAFLVTVLSLNANLASSAPRPIGNEFANARGVNRSPFTDQEINMEYLDNQIRQQRMQSYEDEESLRHLPELIAQAHNDKTMERVLLRLLINATKNNLQTTPSRFVNPYYYNGADTNSLDYKRSVDSDRDDSNGSFPLLSRSGRRDDAKDDDGLDSVLGNSGQPNKPQAGFSKREYVKPCNFNLVSCPKYPWTNNKRIVN